MCILRNGARIVGVAVVLSLTLQAQTFTTLYNFGSQNSDGTDPLAPVIVGPGGVLYGTTTVGGQWNLGTVYGLQPPAAPGGAWNAKVLHSFNGQDGQGPNTGLLRGPNGALFGVTPTSTGTNAMVFELDPPAGARANWAETILYQFPYDASAPPGALVFNTGQFLYSISGTRNGMVYSLTAPAAADGVLTGWTQSILYSFEAGSGGWRPADKLAAGSDGKLFGVTSYGGKISGECPSGCGTVFSLTPPAVSGGPWTETVIHEFEPMAGIGRNPSTGVVIGPTGVLYGTTPQGGHSSYGTVYSLTQPEVPGEKMTVSVLHAFKGTDGATPTALALGPNGVLYGTTVGGGVSGSGTVFELTPPVAPEGLLWTETTLHSFTGQADGGSPNGLTLGPGGTLYGTTWYGGALSHGTVFALKP